MRTLTRGRILALGALLFFVAACGKDEIPAPANGGAAANEGAAAKQGPADSADKAVLAAIDGLKQNHLEAVWDFLPESYQKDLNELVHAFAERMDAEVWAKTVSVVRKLAGVLKTKKEYLSGHATDGNPARRPEQSGTDWAKLAEILDTILDSDLGDLEKLKKAHAGRILAGTGGKILGQLRAFSKLLPDDTFAEDLNRISRTEVKLVSSSGDKARLTLTATDEEPNDVEFVRIEGKWIPQNLADEWIEKMGETRARLSVLSSDTFAEQKPQYLALLSAVDSVLDELSSAKSRDDFTATLQQSAATLLPMIAAIAGPSQPPEGDEGPAERELPGATELVTVVVQSALNDDAQDDVRDKLNALTDERGRASTEFTGDDESTIFKVGPVSDVEGFARQLDFLKVINIDSKNRTIIAELKK